MKNRGHRDTPQKTNLIKMYMLRKSSTWGCMCFTSPVSESGRIDFSVPKLSFLPPVVSPAERIRFILGEEDDGPPPPQLFTELDELLAVDGQEMEWKETARWVVEPCVFKIGRRAVCWHPHFLNIKSNVQHSETLPASQSLCSQRNILRNE